jgi:hypothetical protein
MDMQPYPYASLKAGHIQAPNAKAVKRRALTIVPVELSIERGFVHKPVRRWAINRDLIDFAKAFSVFFVAAMVYLA